MAEILGRYLSHLRQLWQLPHRIDDATVRGSAALADHVTTTALGQQERLIAEFARVGDLILTAEDARLRIMRDAVAALTDSMPPDGIAGRMAERQAAIEVLRRELESLSTSQQLTDHAALGLQRMRLRDRYGALDIETEHPVAYESPDHLVPWGTARDNSRSQAFNARLINLIPSERLSMLDLGCSGGGAVRSMIEQGFLAAGIEGSDYSQRRMRAEWATIPDHLFTADITQPFRIVSDRAPAGVRFGVVTMWEVIEHIAEPDLAPLFANINAHLAPGGLLILSVSPNSDTIEGQELHQTVQERPWWTETFQRLGWTDHPAIIAWFGNDLVRWEENAPNSFHFALSRSSETPDLTRRARHLLGGVGKALVEGRA